jgi:hypothetical protein
MLRRSPLVLRYALQKAWMMLVSIDAILEALCEFDSGPPNPSGEKPQRQFSTARAQAA